MHNAEFLLREVAFGLTNLFLSPKNQPWQRAAVSVTPNVRLLSLFADTKFTEDIAQQIIR
tara:strand:- start:21 stop:200 length:180 start_codon:yes stop_codon:yes gene_type:complete